jgi:AcrR family transcriptional regulator
MKQSSTLPRTTRGQATRAALLAALERQVAALGFDELTSSAVAAEAGVSTGTFYGYFDDKHTALAAAFARRLDELVGDVAAVFTADHLLDHGLADTLRAAVDRVVAHYRHNAPVLRAALARIPADPRLREIYWDGHRRSVQLVEQFVRRGATAGLVRDDAPPSVLAHTLLILTQSLHHPVIVQPHDEDLVGPVREEVTRALIHLLRPTDAEETHGK